MRTIRRLLVCLLSVAALRSAAIHLGFVMPAGARTGTTVELIVGGQGFGGVDGVWVTGGGVTAESVTPVRSIPHPEAGQRRYLNQWLRGIHKGEPAKPPLPEDTSGWRSHPFFDRLDTLSDCERDILYRFLFVPGNSLQASPAINSRVLIRLRVEPDAEPGEREFRLLAKGRVSNPMKFFIGTVPECREPYFSLPPAKPQTPHFTAPAVLNGQIMPGETDRFTFAARKGETVTFRARARDLLPFIGDGVPGHFQMVLEVRDADGRAVAWADDRFFDPDPELEFTAPAEGTYTLAVRDALYRGRADFVYRIDAVPGPAPRRKIAAPELPGIRVVSGSTLPAGKPAAFPTLIRDVLRTAGGNRYLFHAEAGTPVMLEVFARRQGSPADPLLRVRDAAGRLLAVSDDVPRLKVGTILHRTADPELRFIPPASGVYTAEVSDLTGACGPEYEYFLRIDRVRPRFAVYAVPSATEINLTGVGVTELVVERFDGFAGEIKLRLRDAGDVTIAGPDAIPAGCDRAKVTFRVKNQRRSLPAAGVLEASAGKFVTRVIPGDEMMQAFAYTHIVPARQMLFSRERRGPGRERFSWAEPRDKVTLDRELTLTANMNLRNLPADAEAELVMVDPPKWLHTVPERTKRAVSGQVKSVPENRKKPAYFPLRIGLRAAPEGRGQAVNQLFKVVWKYNSRPDKDGKVRRIVQESILPAVRIEGGR
ncbi:MAG: hypothetical protein MR051_03570 [Lentisphaeria bacterium]|nr:hypothetical protein [Lentisphaeria bacterium]